MGGFQASYAETVDCDRVFTRLEHAICTNPQLYLLDRELARLSAIAIRQQILSQQGIGEMRNDLALRCARQEQVDACLIGQEKEQIQVLSLHTGRVSAQASDESGETTAGLSALKELRIRLLDAQKHQDKTGDVGMLVDVTLELLSFYRTGNRFLATEVKRYEIRALQNRIDRGCRDVFERPLWTSALRLKGLSCEIPVQISSLG